VKGEKGSREKVRRVGKVTKCCDGSNVLTNFCVYYKFKFEFLLTESIISQISGKSISQDI
jgi:hypothetical protein